MWRHQIFQLPVTLLVFADRNTRHPFFEILLCFWTFISWNLKVTSYDVIKYSNPCIFVVFADRNTRLLFLRSWYFTDLISWNRKWRHMTSSNVQTPVTFLFLQIETWDFHFWDPVMFLIRFNESGSDITWRHQISQPFITLLFLQIETRDFCFWGPGMFLILFLATGSYVIWCH